MKTNTTTAAKLLEVSRQLGLSLPEVMLRRERELNETPPEVVYEKLRVAYGIMRQAVEESLREPHKTMGGLIGGEARKLAEYRAAGKNLCGETVSRAICYAMGVLEVSASMGLIVAAPTAGASGVLPGVLIALQEQYGLTERQMLDALLVARCGGGGKLRHQRGGGRLPGRGGNRQRHGCRFLRLSDGGQPGAVLRGSRAGHPEYVGAGMRSHCRAGGGPLPGPKRGRGFQCLGFRRAGAGRGAGGHSL